MNLYIEKNFKSRILYRFCSPPPPPPPPSTTTTLLLVLSRLPPLALSSAALLPLTPPPPPLLLLALLPRRARRASSGSLGCRPLARAKRFRMSVRLTTPLRRPDMCCPGRADAETEGVDERGWNGGVDCGREEVERWGGWAGGWAMEIGAEWVEEMELW